MRLRVPPLLPTLLLVLFACATGPAVAGPIEDGLAAYRSEDYETALRLLRPLAEKGDAAAQWGLGAMYANGLGVPFDGEAGVAWLRKSAGQSFAEAEFSLGVLYENGFGVPQSNQEAAGWYRKAADQGHPAAQYNIGVMYEHGQGVARDLVQAHLWLSLAIARLDPVGDALMRNTAVEDLNRLTPKLTPSQLAEAKRRAGEWKPKSPR